MYVQYNIYIYVLWTSLNHSSSCGSLFFSGYPPLRLTALRVVTAGLAELVLGNFATAAGRQLGIWVAGKSTQVAGKWRLKIFLHVVYDAIKRFAKKTCPKT